MPKPAKLERAWNWTKVVDWLDDHNGAITVVLTAVLVAVTIRYVALQQDYLVEVKEQRKFSYQQMIIQNQPAIEILSPRPFSYDDTAMTTAFKITNKGGPAMDVGLIGFIICCTDKTEIAEREEEIQHFGFGSYGVRVGRGTNSETFARLVGEDRARLEMEAKNPEPRIYAYVRVYYAQPSVDVPGTTETATLSQSFYWSADFKQWLSEPVDIHQDLGSLLEKRHAFDLIEEKLDLQTSAE